MLHYNHIVVVFVPKNTTFRVSQYFGDSNKKTITKIIILITKLQTNYIEYNNNKKDIEYYNNNNNNNNNNNK